MVIERLDEILLRLKALTTSVNFLHDQLVSVRIKKDRLDDNYRVNAKFIDDTHDIVINGILYIVKCVDKKGIIVQESKKNYTERFNYKQLQELMDNDELIILNK